MQHSTSKDYAICELKICLARMARDVGEYKKSAEYYQDAMSAAKNLIKRGNLKSILVFSKLWIEYKIVNK